MNHVIQLTKFKKGGLFSMRKFILSIAIVLMVIIVTSPTTSIAQMSTVDTIAPKSYVLNEAVQESKITTGKFSDLKKNEAGYDEVLSLVNQGIITGYGDGSFKPHDKISRQHVAVLLHRALNLNDAKNKTKTLKSVSDIPNDYFYADEIASVIESGVFKGSNGKFQPNANITRGQMATVLVRAFQLKDLNMNVNLIDLNKIAKAHRPNVKILAQNQITTGKLNKKGQRYFDAADHLTRVQFAMLLKRTLDHADSVGKEDEQISDIEKMENEAIQLTNLEREKHGLKPLKIDNKLQRSARTKSIDMKNNNYFSHESPIYGKLPDLMATFNINYRAAAENIAHGFTTPDAVVNAWMNSDGHRKNILNGNFTHIGIGYDYSKHIWTQHFIQK